VRRQQERTERDDDEPGREQAGHSAPRQMLRFALSLELENRILGRARARCCNRLCHGTLIGTRALGA
jgi:hypothetical protein